MLRILTINPGSTSTRAVLFADGATAWDVEIAHPRDWLAGFPRIMDQLEPRRELLARAIAEHGGTGPLDAVVGRGGFLGPMPGGVYAVNQAMLEELAQRPTGQHASNLGAFLAVAFAREHGCPALVVDPVVTDELDDRARLTGLPAIARRTVFHALGQRGAAREAAARLGLDYAAGRFVVAHLGGGISVGAHRLGRVADVTNAMDGEGPFSPERCGALPVLPVLALLESGEWTPAALRAVLIGRAGLSAHLGESDLRVVEARMDAGDAQAANVFEAMAYAVAKTIASMTPALEGPVDAVVLCGGMARSKRLCARITELAGFLGRVEVVTGVEEMAAMALGAQLMLTGRVPLRDYPPARPEDGLAQA
uniref:Probable butyrate kinase n=1 Tax=Fundidesulfovibrio putealis TaxID=270496 RepID=A0A7C4AHF3_9BACT